MDLVNSPTDIYENVPPTLQELSCQVQVLSLASDEIRDCFRLRYSYFVEERGWVPPSAHEIGFERDSYDNHALHLVVLDSKGVAAYLRLLPFNPAVGFMLDHELCGVLTAEARQALPRDNAVEVSRLVMRSGVGLDVEDQIHPLELLFKGFYQEVKARGFRRFYIVVEQAWIRLFARRFGLVFQVLGLSYTFPDGTKTVAATAIIEELEEGMRRYDAAKFAWYQQDE